jgi:CubicO group peptidase (beta-lactamase class C family)
MISNARSLAKVADLMSRKALFSSPEMHDKAMADTRTSFDHGMYMETKFNQGGWCDFSDERFWDKSVHGFVGWGGFGGSAIAWNQEKQIGIAYTMNGPFFGSIMGFRDPRCLNLMRNTIKSIEAVERIHQGTAESRL